MNLNKKITSLQKDLENGGIFSNLIIPCIVAAATAFMVALLLG